MLRCDNGPELVCAALTRWCADRVGIAFIDPGCPWQNPWVESFNGRFRDECLNLNHFRSLLEARVVITDWRHEYNTLRPHSALRYQTPAAYAAGCAHTHPTRELPKDPGPIDGDRSPVPRTVTISLPPDRTEALLSELGGVDALLTLSAQRAVSVQPPGDVVPLRSREGKPPPWRPRGCPPRC